MQLIEALKAASGRSPDGRFVRLSLICGFTPLHFETFLKAYAMQAHSGCTVNVTCGLYGDLAGSLERLDAADADACVIVIEWPDLDQRLGARCTGGWLPEKLGDITESARLSLERISRAIQKLDLIPVAISLPTLPLPPVAYTTPYQLSAFEADLRSHLTVFARSHARAANVQIVTPQALDMTVSLDRRFDLNSELLTGFPYAMEHAETLARLLANATRTRARKKGIITDLDDTLWRGILGEVGAQNVSWTIDHRAQVHGLYQQLLGSLAAAGTLVAVASKNNPELVADALRRPDLLISKNSIFPIDIDWGAKSQSVSRILRAWNINPDMVVFVDDSPMELAEVKAAFPDVECVLFPKDDPAEFWRFLFELREWFGATQILKEDALRTESLRARAQFEADFQHAPSDADNFLRAAEAEITFDNAKAPDARAFELINKTNQFNLNGIRLSEGDWKAILSDDSHFILKVAYKDKYGPLGTIAVLAGASAGSCVCIEHWVMSCRAFSRRIEHRCLEWVFERFDASEVKLKYAPTSRNEPVREFLSQFVTPAPSVRLERSVFAQACPPLFQSIKDVAQ